MDDRQRVSLGKKASNIALLVNISLTLSKGAVGFFANSTAIIADAFNNGTDIFATIAVFSGIRVAYRPPDENHHYGHVNAEPIVSKIVAIIVMITGGAIGWDSVNQIISGASQTPGSLAIVISAVSIFTKYFLYRYTNKIGKIIGSASIVADSYNHRSDVLASLSALVGVAGARLGLPILDPAAGLLVSIIIFKTGISIYIDAVNALMDTAPPAEVIENIINKAKETAGVIEVNQLKARKHGNSLRIDLKICVDKDISVEAGHKIAANAKSNIIKKVENVEDVMIHVNPCNHSYSSAADCKTCSYNKK